MLLYFSNYFTHQYHEYNIIIFKYKKYNVAMLTFINHNVKGRRKNKLQNKKQLLHK